jgi:hypothetical protein
MGSPSIERPFFKACAVLRLNLMMRFSGMVVDGL